MQRGDLRRHPAITSHWARKLLGPSHIPFRDNLCLTQPPQILPRAILRRDLNRPADTMLRVSDLGHYLRDRRISEIIHDPGTGRRNFPITTEHLAVSDANDCQICSLSCHNFFSAVSPTCRRGKVGSPGPHQRELHSRTRSWAGFGLSLRLCRSHGWSRGSGRCFEASARGRDAHHSAYR